MEALDPCGGCMNCFRRGCGTKGPWVIFTDQRRDIFRTAVNNVLGEEAMLNLGKQDSLRLTKCHVEFLPDLQLAKQTVEHCLYSSSVNICVGYQNIAALLDLALIPDPTEQSGAFANQKT